MSKLTNDERLWRCNYWYRVWYRAIPGLPDDQITLNKIGNMWNSGVTEGHTCRLGDLFTDDKRLYGYNDLENMLSVADGLLHLHRFRIFRIFPNEEDWLTEENWEKLEQENWEYMHVDALRASRGEQLLQIETRFSRLKRYPIVLKDIDKNALKFAENDILRMAAPEVSISESVQRTNISTEKQLGYHRFPNILHLLQSTELPLPPSGAALPGKRYVSWKQYEKFLGKCPDYMRDYVDKLVEPQSIRLAL